VLSDLPRNVFPPAAAVGAVCAHLGWDHRQSSWIGQLISSDLPSLRRRSKGERTEARGADQAEQRARCAGVSEASTLEKGKKFVTTRSAVSSISTVTMVLRWANPWVATPVPLTKRPMVLCRQRAEHAPVTTGDSTAEPKTGIRSIRLLRILPIAIVIAAVMGLVGWFATSTTQRIGDLEAENVALHGRVVELVSRY
jgi:hypothetical protein